jgi:Cys-tRNA(Pro)/Cys-tRNA(Cys) deacylase
VSDLGDKPMIFWYCIARKINDIETSMTPAVIFLQQKGAQFQVLEYLHDQMTESYGLEAVKKLGLEASAVFKTLVVALDSGEHVVALVPSRNKLNMKQLAKSAKAKKATMAEVNKVQNMTGYILGGVSPFGQKKRLKTFVDSSAISHDLIYVSGGKRGLELQIVPTLLSEYLGATFVSIAE